MLTESIPVTHLADKNKGEKERGYGVGLIVGQTMITNVDKESGLVEQNLRLLVIWENKREGSIHQHSPDELNTEFNFHAWFDDHFNNDNEDDDDDEEEDDDEAMELAPVVDLDEDDFKNLAAEFEGVGGVETEVLDEVPVDDDEIVLSGEDLSYSDSTIHNNEVRNKINEATL